jgi:phospholipid/cholesterol/gamma-HCH transport system substrate-binding protein
MKRTRRDAIRVGIFVVIAGTLLAGGLLWIAGSRFFRPVATYNVLFEKSVSGLNAGANVEYQGVVVGRVRDIQLTSDIPPNVAVIIDLNPETPVRTDTIAALLGSLVTGIKFIQLQGGSESAGPLAAGGVIHGDVTSLEQFRDQLAEMADRALNILRRFDEQVFTPEISAQVTSFVANLSGVAKTLNDTLGTFRSEETGRDIAQLVRDLSSATENLNKVLTDFYARRDSLYGGIETTLRHLDEVVTQTRDLVKTATQQVGGTSTSIGGLLGDLGNATSRLQETIDVIRSDPSLLLRGREVKPRELER